MNPNEPPKENTTGLLRLFVYGTLKRGCWNHERFCRGVLSVEEAVVRGRLYELPSGIPVLEVPEADVLAHGTADPLADVATQARLAAEFAARAAHPELGENGAPGGRWGPVYGELLTFDDPETRLPAIDHLEGFLPDGPSLYRRVLVPTIIHEVIVPAWLYASGRPPDRHARPLSGSRWR
jgi:gamma-glutamylcyclotransferase (GGCT)/AIG2-like uncharacterized protein YtfP